jgi:predicted MFS family arabinose efflux permease
MRIENQETLIAPSLLQCSRLVQYALLKAIKGDPSQMFSYNISLLNLGIGLGSLIGGLLFSYDQSFYSSFLFSILLGILSLLLVVLGLNRKSNYPEQDSL